MATDRLIKTLIEQNLDLGYLHSVWKVHAIIFLAIMLQFSIWKCTGKSLLGNVFVANRILSLED